MLGKEGEAECSGRKEIRVQLRYCRYQWMGESEQAQEKYLVEQDLREDRRC